MQWFQHHTMLFEEENNLIVILRLSSDQTRHTPFQILGPILRPPWSDDYDSEEY